MENTAETLMKSIQNRRRASQHFTDAHSHLRNAPKPLLNKGQNSSTASAPGRDAAKHFPTSHNDIEKMKNTSETLMKPIQNRQRASQHFTDAHSHICNAQKPLQNIGQNSSTASAPGRDTAEHFSITTNAIRK